MKLDHLYFGFNRERFEGVCEKHPNSPYSVHKTVVTPDDSWEGLYIFCKNKTYFEYLNERRANKMGIAIRSATPAEEGAPIEVKANSHLNWKYGTRRFEDGRFWFNWFSLNDYREMETPFNFWIMQYDYSILKKMALMPSANSPFLSIDTMQIEASFALRNHFSYSSQFFKEIVSDSSDSSTINFLDTQVRIRWVDLMKNHPIELLDLKFKS